MKAASARYNPAQQNSFFMHIVEDKRERTWAFNIDDASQGIPRKLADGLFARIFSGKNVMLSVVHLEANAVGTPHSHPEEQWGLLLAGQCVRIQGDEEKAMLPGDFWHTPGDVVHSIRAGATGATVLDIFSPPREDYQKAGEGFGGSEPNGA